jgi:uncharacterized protein YecE (DUF72 family)
MEYQIGCSGFHYKHWKGNFYPEDLPQKKWFEYYCKFFDTVELNVTFYHFPELTTLEGWYEKSPDNFQFAVKAPRLITHFKKFVDVTHLLDQFYEVVNQGLKEKLGCVLFQFPPSFHYSEERLERIINSLDTNYHNVVEFRQQDWWKTEVYSRLGKRNISFCGMSHPDFPNEIIANSSVLYYRMHGSTQLYASNYSNQDLGTFLKQLKKEKQLKKAFIYFNNDALGFATKNAATLLQKVHLRQG